MRTSYSAMETYKSCPLKYKYSQIDKIPAPKSREAVFGTVIHSALKFMFSRDPLYPTLDESIDFFSSKWDTASKKTEWTSDTEKDIFYKQGLAILKKFYAGNPPWNFDTLDVESRFELDVKDEKTGETHTIAGIIDRIDKKEDGTYEIVDYKTAKRIPAQSSFDNDPQLPIYQMGLLSRWPHMREKKVDLTLHFLKHNEKITIQKTNKELEQTRRNILSTIKEISEKQKTGDFKPMPSPLCDWCPYKKICPVWKHLYQKDASEENIGEQDVKKTIKEYFEIKEKQKSDSARLKELQAILHNYMNQKGVLRLFGDEGYVSKTIRESPVYDMEKIKEILHPAGLWENILKTDDKKLSEIIPKLPAETREKIKKAIVDTKTTATLTIRKQKS